MWSLQTVTNLDLQKPCVNLDCHKPQSMSTYVRKCEWGMRDRDIPERLPKNGLFGVRLVKRMSSIANIFFFEVATPNGSAIHRTFATQMNAVHCTLATRTHQHFSHFRMPHSAFVYRCGHGFTRAMRLTQSSYKQS